MPRSFYEPSAEVVAPALLGHWLLCRTPEGLCGGPIVETEAYLVGDEACHGFLGPTQRNRSLFGPPGHAYVYLIYGFHFCFNAVCQPAGRAEAVLIRAIEAGLGEDLMQARRPVGHHVSLTNGPGKLCQALGIDRGMDSVDLCDPSSRVIIGRNPLLKQFRSTRGALVTTTRIGITRAAGKLLRFYLDSSKFVSRKEARRGSQY